MTNREKTDKNAWKDEELKQYVCRIIPVGGKKASGYREFTQVIWALDPEDAEYRLRGWKQSEYDVKFMHSLDEFNERMAKERALEAEIKKIDEANSRKPSSTVEMENV